MAKQKVNFLLLRGLTREKSHWGNFLPLLMKANPGAQVFCLDLPGVGTENNRLSPLSVAGITDDLRARWRKTFSKSKLGDWVCVGHSLGGMIALDWQDRYSKDFAGVVTINTSSRGMAPFYRRASVFALAQFARIAVARDVETREQLVLGLTSNLNAENKKILADWISFAKARPMHAQTAARQLAAASVFKARSPGKVPLLFLCSEKDKLAHISCSEELARHFRAETCAHKRAGHDLALDDPAWVVEKLLEFASHLD